MSTNRSINIKESKEKKNREKLLAGPGSEFSLANAEDFEMDYYDYNVINAANAPGSYLGMDPAYLVWIPPLDGEIDGQQQYDDSEHSNESDATDEDNNEPDYEEISPTYENTQETSFSCNDMTPESFNSKSININEMNSNCSELNKILVATAFNTMNDEIDSPKSSLQKKSSTSTLTSRKAMAVDSIQMTEFKSPKSNRNYRQCDSPAKVHQIQSYQYYQEQRSSYASDDKDNDTEKETAVVKSPSNNFKEYYELDDIQFADDDDDDDDIDSLNSNRNDSVSVEV